MCAHPAHEKRYYAVRDRANLVERCNACRRARRGRPRYRPEVERFWMRVVRDPDTECWEWAGKHNAEGRPVFLSDSGEVYAYRYLVTYADDEDFHHTCENPGCVNPSHGKPLTRSEHRKLHGSLRS